MKILPAVAAIIFFAVGATAQTTNDLSDAEIQGRQLAQKLLEQQPTEDFTNLGTLQIRREGSEQTKINLECETIVTKTNWIISYKGTKLGLNLIATDTLQIIHAENQSEQFHLNSSVYFAMLHTNSDEDLNGQNLLKPFADSDFWICDLGLEFFHWPEQKILKKENRRSRACEVLESTNPNPSTNGYSRVDSWIDEESGGIVHAEAYDAQNKLLKVFDPKSFKKVNGQWQVDFMEMENVQTGSRSWIDFNPAGTPPPKK